VRWGRGHGLPVAVLLALCTAGLVPSLARADWTDFAPRPLETGAFFDTYASYEQDHTSTGGTPSRWSDTFIRERVTLFSNGYSYHPRFIRYQFSISGALKQEDYWNSQPGPTGWSDQTGFEYDCRLVVLPEHAYNLRLFAARYEPLFKQQTTTQHNNIENTRGALFRYRRKPYFAHLSYTDNSVESGTTTSDVQTVTGEGEYFKRYATGNQWSVTGNVSPSWFSNSAGLNGSATQYLATNVVNLTSLPAWAPPLRLYSSVSDDTFDQHSSISGTFTSDQLSWYELLTLYLPANFRSDASYRYQDTHSTNAAPDGPSQTLSDINNDARFDLVHRLYESLDTTYALLYDSRSSSGGDIWSLTNSLALNYTKAIPVGRLLLGGSVAATDTTNTGQVSIVDQLYPGIPVPGSFTIQQQNVAPDSIIVYLECSDAHPCAPPLVPGQIVPLVENTDYTLTPADNGTTFTINVITLPQPLVVPGVYDFLVSYSLTGGNYELRTDTYSGTASVELFDNLLTPYVNYLAVRTAVLSGVFLNPVDSTTYTGGLIVTRGPVRLRGEYQDSQWPTSPYQAWRVDVQYVSAIDATTSVYATAGYLNKHFPHGTSETATAPFTDELTSASASLQKEIVSRNLFVTVGGNYSYLQGEINGDSYSATSSLLWKIGRVDLTLGANVYGADTSGGSIATGAATIANQRDHQFFYLKMSRRLF
jgi:hypothetical protein